MFRNKRNRKKGEKVGQFYRTPVRSSLLFRFAPLPAPPPPPPRLRRFYPFRPPSPAPDRVRVFCSLLSPRSISLNPAPCPPRLVDPIPVMVVWAALLLRPRGDGSGLRGDPRRRLQVPPAIGL
ncbi:hypothetical protein BHE74_00016111 [Ensete ventricosum]|nr:hypothetical protein GW17_00020183 [Ensete ventricosum]RWW75849.1 hypothetical protein BHE74_00016111 [Ensete ventricosum]